MSQTAPDSGAKTIWMVLGLIGGVVVLMLLCTGVIGYLVWRGLMPMVDAARQMVQDIQATEALGKAFLADIRDGKLDAAYEKTSPGFKSRMSRVAFDAFVKEHASLKQQQLQVDRDPADPMPSAGKDKGSYQLVIKGPGRGKAEFVLRFVKEQGSWMIDGLNVEEGGEVAGAARSFVELIKDPKWNESAYQLTTADFRKRWNRARLEEFLKKHLVPAVFVLGTPSEREGQSYAVLLLNLDQEEDHVFEIILKKEGTVWRVDDLKAEENK